MAESHPGTGTHHVDHLDCSDVTDRQTPDSDAHRSCVGPDRRGQCVRQEWTSHTRVSEVWEYQQVCVRGGPATDVEHDWSETRRWCFMARLKLAQRGCVQNHSMQAAGPCPRRHDELMCTHTTLMCTHTTRMGTHTTRMCTHTTLMCLRLRVSLECGRSADVRRCRPQ